MKSFYLKFKKRFWAVLLTALFIGINASAAVWPIPNTSIDTLRKFIEDTSKWNAGDTIILSEQSTYEVDTIIKIKQSLVFTSDTSLLSNPVVRFINGTGGFLVINDSINFTIAKVNFNGIQSDNIKYTTSLLSFLANVTCLNNRNFIIKDCEASGFVNGIILTKYQRAFYDTIIIDNVIFHNIKGTGGLVIEPSINYTKYMSITNSTFYDIEYGFLANVGWDRKTGTYAATKDTMITKKIIIDNNTFFNAVGKGNKSLIQMNDPNDNSIDLLFSDNIVNQLYAPNDARPFRIDDALAGSFKFRNSTIFNYNYTGANTAYYAFNFDSVAKFNYIDTAMIYKADPLFADTATRNFTLPDTSGLYFASTTGGPIGDPRWAPLATAEVVVISAPLNKVIAGIDNQLEATVNIQGSVDKTVTWSVTNGTGEATIDPATGLLSPTKIGTITVKAVSNYNSAYFDEITLTIVEQIMVSDIVLDSRDQDNNVSTDIKNLGWSLTITASVEPGNADNKTIAWSISDTNIAKLTVQSPTIAAVSAKKCGEVTVLVAAQDGSGVKDSVVITIVGQYANITVSGTDGATTITEDGGTLQMTATYMTETDCDPGIEWSVDYDTVASISASGLLTALNDGVVKVTATATDGTGKSANKTITISNQVSAVNDASLSTLQVVPNPANDFITIKSEMKSQIVVNNILGAVVFSGDVDANAAINISEWKAGIYIVNIKSGDIQRTIRLVKE